MKKLKKLLVAVPLALASSMAFVGCSDPHEHNLKLTGATAADCDSAGNSAYYTCETCGKYYSDDKGATEIAQNSWVINPLGHLFMNADDHDCNRGCGLIRETSAYNVWDGTVATALPNAVNGVITISTAEQLAKVAALVNAGNTFEGVTIKLSANIDLDGRAWTPIGNSNRKTSADIKKFKGTFDGDGHKVMNLTNEGFTPTDTREETSEFNIYTYGLFGYVENATIKNLTVEVNITSAENLKGDAVAGLVGFAKGSLTLDNCTVNGSVAGFDSVAGLVGRIQCNTNADVVSITDCINNAAITGMVKTAGIIAFLQDNYNVTIDSCINNGVIKATGAVSGNLFVSNCAGIVNYTWNTNLVNPYTLIITNNINTANLYNKETLNSVTGKTDMNSFSTIANQSGQWFAPEYNAVYDFTGNTNTGKVYVAGVETDSFIISAYGQDQAYDVASEFNNTTSTNA